MDKYLVRPVGFVKSEHTKSENTPIQPIYAYECTGTLHILPEYEDGLLDIEGFSHIILLYWLHKARFDSLLVKPYLQDVEHGIFATRFPHRPNPIGLSIVKLIRRDKSILHIQGVDILDGTPVLDIKPYSTVFDCFIGAHNGWMEDIDKQVMDKRGRRGYKSDPEGGSGK